MKRASRSALISVAVAALLLLASLASGAAFALDPDTITKLAFGENEDRLQAIDALVAAADPAAIDVLRALAEGELQTADKRVLIVRGAAARDAITGAAVAPLPEGRQDVVANNRIRGAIATAIASLRLRAPDPRTRLAAATELAGNADSAMLPLVKKALAEETNADVRALLERTVATVDVIAGDPAARVAAARLLGESEDPSTKTLLLTLLKRNPDGTFVEADGDLRSAAELSLRKVESRLAWSEKLGLAFAGISLGSILLLAALGLAITYGLMGVINMAHGELIMIGAYTTFVVQNAVRSVVPGAFDWYLLAAIPASFAVSAGVGMALERSVIRWLYGRPLETLLATWGISLILMQSVRSLFGAQNVQVENPAFMSGGIQVLANVVLPWSRIMIIGFAAAVLIAGVAAAHPHATRSLRARRHPESRDGELRRRADRAGRYLGVRSGFRSGRPRRLRALADRQRRAGPRPGLHHRFVHGGRAGWRGATRRHGVRGASASDS